MVPGVFHDKTRGAIGVAHSSPEAGGNLDRSHRGRVEGPAARSDRHPQRPDPTPAVAGRLAGRAELQGMKQEAL